MTGSCGECAHWDSLRRDGTIGIIGECRKYAPRAGGFARTKPDDWCGEYELHVLDAEIVDDEPVGGVLGPHQIVDGHGAVTFTGDLYDR